MKPIGQLDTSHAMYQPAKRAPKLKRYERWQTTQALKTEMKPDPNGSRDQREAWMRQRQAQLGHEREKLRMPNPPRETQQKWIDEGEK